MQTWLMAGEQKFDFTQVKSITLYRFVSRNMAKFRDTGTMDRKIGSGGSNKITRQAVTMIKRLSMNRKRRSNRKVAAMVGTSKDTVRRYLKKSGAKAYHRRKVQAMKSEHRDKRIEFARWALQQYGVVINGNTTWGRLVNTDFFLPW